jgi:hypothetical protein
MLTCNCLKNPYIFQQLLMFPFPAYQTLILALSSHTENFGPSVVYSTISRITHNKYPVRSKQAFVTETSGLISQRSYLNLLLGQ